MTPSKKREIRKWLSTRGNDLGTKGSCWWELLQPYAIVLKVPTGSNRAW